VSGAETILHVWKENINPISPKNGKGTIVNFEIKNTFCTQVCHIWPKDINIGYFVDSSTMAHFRKVFKNMIDPNVKVKV